MRPTTWVANELVEVRVYHAHIEVLAVHDFEFWKDGIRHLVDRELACLLGSEIHYI